jgi:hypothetical protein
MRRAVLATAIAMAAVGLPASPAAASVCSQDGVARNCVDAMQSQDVLALNSTIAQFDGPGLYSLYYVDTDTGTPGIVHTVGPLGYPNAATGTLYAQLNHCYDVHLDSAPGTSLVVPSVCG